MFDACAGSLIWRWTKKWDRRRKRRRRRRRRRKRRDRRKRRKRKVSLIDCGRDGVGAGEEFGQRCYRSVLEEVEEEEEEEEKGEEGEEITSNPPLSLSLFPLICF